MPETTSLPDWQPLFKKCFAFREAVIVVGADGPQNNGPACLSVVLMHSIILCGGRQGHCGYDSWRGSVKCQSCCVRWAVSDRPLSPTSSVSPVTSLLDPPSPNDMRAFWAHAGALSGPMAGPRWCRVPLLLPVRISYTSEALESEMCLQI